MEVRFGGANESFIKIKPCFLFVISARSFGSPPQAAVSGSCELLWLWRVCVCTNIGQGVNSCCAAQSMILPQSFNC